jgi:hypothetical protein
MSIGIGNEHEVSPFQVVLRANEVLRVTPDGQFIWNPDADRMIEEGDFSSSPAMPHILRALRKREWVGLTDDEMLMIYGQQHEGKKYNLGRMVEAKLKKKNGYAEEKNT